MEGFIRKLWIVGSEERMWKISIDGKNRAEVGVTWWHGTLFGYKGWRLTSGEEGLNEAGSVGHQGGCRFVPLCWPMKREWSAW